MLKQNEGSYLQYISRKYIPGLSKTRLSMNNWHVSVRSLKALSLGYGLLVTDPVSLKSLTVLMTVDSSTPRLWAIEEYPSLKHSL